MCFFLVALGLPATLGLSLVAVSRSYSLVAMRGLLIAVACHVQTRVLEFKGFSSYGARAYLLLSVQDLPGPGIEPMSPALAGGFLTTTPPGKPFFQLCQ